MDPGLQDDHGGRDEARADREGDAVALEELAGDEDRAEHGEHGAQHHGSGR